MIIKEVGIDYNTTELEIIQLKKRNYLLCEGETHVLQIASSNNEHINTSQVFHSNT